MTMTVKLDAVLEQRLRLQSAATGRPASDIIRAALSAWLDDTQVASPSAHALGADLFGRHHGAADLATQRKAVAADAWAGRHDRRASRA